MARRLREETAGERLEVTEPACKAGPEGGRKAMLAGLSWTRGNNLVTAGSPEARGPG